MKNFMYQPINLFIFSYQYSLENIDYFMENLVPSNAWITNVRWQLYFQSLIEMTVSDFNVLLVYHCY